MKQLEQLNNVERAKLLFELLPQQIPGFVHCMKAIAEIICNDPEKLKQQWDGQILTADFWIELAKDAKSRIEKNEKELLKNSRRFSDQLFDGYNALFAVHCLQEYCKQPEADNKFNRAVELLFL